MRILNTLLAISFRMVRPILGPAVCIFPAERCTAFSIRQLKEQPLPIALGRIVWRLFSCNPFNKNPQYHHFR